MTKVASGPLPAPSPSPSPTPPAVEPVRGSIEVITEDTSWNDQLGLAGDGDPSEGSVEATADAVRNSLDRFLDSAQAGTPDLGIIGAVWTRDVNPRGAAILLRGLTTPDNPVAAASYLMYVHLEPDPRLVATSVQVRRHDDSRVKVELVFDVTGSSPRVQVVGEAKEL